MICDLKAHLLVLFGKIGALAKATKLAKAIQMIKAINAAKARFLIALFLIQIFCIFLYRAN